MGIFDLLGFDEDDYEERLKSRSDQELLLHERKKRRQFVSSRSSIATGIVSTAAIGPAGLLLSAYGARNLDVAEQKHRCLLPKLSRKSIEPLEPTASDLFVPLACSVTGAAIAPIVGPALHACAQHLVPAGTHLVDSGLSTAHTAVASHHIGQTANAATHDFLSGVKDASDQLVHNVAPSHAAPDVTRGISDFFSDHTVTTSSAAANIIGHDLGQKATLGVAQEGVTRAVTKAAQHTLELADSRPVVQKTTYTSSNLSDDELTLLGLIALSSGQETTYTSSPTTTVTTTTLMTTTLSMTVGMCRTCTTMILSKYEGGYLSYTGPVQDATENASHGHGCSPQKSDQQQLQPDQAPLYPKLSCQDHSTSGQAQRPNQGHKDTPPSMSYRGTTTQIRRTYNLPRMSYGGKARLQVTPDYLPDMSYTGTATLQDTKHAHSRSVTPSAIDPQINLSPPRHFQTLAVPGRVPMETSSIGRSGSGYQSQHANSLPPVREAFTVARTPAGWQPPSRPPMSSGPPVTARPNFYFYF